RLVYSWLTACLVPKVAGMRLDDARERIRRASCSVGAVRFKASRGPRGVVVSQRPQARAERRIGTKVSLAVSVRRRQLPKRLGRPEISGTTIRIRSARRRAAACARCSCECALEGGSAVDAAVRREDVLDRSVEERTQAFGDFLPRHVLP